MKNQIKSAVLISYFNIFLNMMIGIFFTPFLISSLGKGEYGVYKIIQSFSSQLTVISFGLSTLVARNIVYYNELNKKEEKENFLFMATIISYLIGVMTVVAGGILYLFIDKMYANSLTATEIQLAKKLFSILVLNVTVSIISDLYIGFMSAYEKFAIVNGMRTVRLVLRVVLLIVLLKSGVKSIGIVTIDLLLTTLLFVFLIFYCKSVIKEKSKFHYWDWEMIKTSFAFSLAVIMQSIVNQVNQTVDNVILGIMTSPEVVTVYSSALILYTSFNSVVIVISGLFGPRATKLVANKATGEALTEFCIKPARIQFMIAGLAITGFILFGKSFVEIWLGKGFEEVYIIALVLMIPVVIPLIENITIAILDAMLKRLFRSIVVFVMCVLNVITSVIMIKYIGYMGAAYGTALSLIIGHGILMNIYLHKKIGINIFNLFKGVFSGTILAIVIACLCGNVFLVIPETVTGFLIKVICYTLLYSIIMYFIGLNKEEKNLIKNIIRKFYNGIKRKV